MLMWNTPEETATQAGKDRHVFLFPDKILVAARKPLDAPGASPGFEFVELIEVGAVSIFI
jgi:hypothetical protein